MPANTIRTYDNRQRLLAAAQRGATNRDAAQLTGISESALYTWLAEDQEFGDAYARERAEGRMKSIRLIADSDDWRAHAWLLERVDPEHWGKAETSPESLARKLDAYLQGVNDSTDADETRRVSDAHA